MGGVSVGFAMYDIPFLVISLLLLVIFFYKKRSNFTIEGPMYLYKTKFGLKLIDWFGKKHARWLRPLEYVVIFCGYILMVFGVWLIAYSAYVYIKYPAVMDLVRAPPIFPIFPYFTKFFGLSTFFPPFYFTYFIIAIAIVAVSHEFAHGIFARLNNIRIKSTGFGFLRLFKLPLPLFGAFVEQDDRDMQKRSKFAQLSVLGAGVFANILLAGLFLVFFWLFFIVTFQPLGVAFSDYAVNSVNISSITAIEGQKITDVSSIGEINLSDDADFISVGINDVLYYTTPYVLQETLKKDIGLLGVYGDSPAFNAKLKGAIISFDGKKISSREDLINGILGKKPGDKVEIETWYDGEIEYYEIILSERAGKAYLGISTPGAQKGRGLLLYINMLTPKINNYFTGVVYESKIGDFGLFVFNLFWWIVVINALVALFNMIPVGIFDGGRFFMLTMWGITGSKKVGEVAFKWSTIIMLGFFALMMVRWLFGYF